MSHQVDSVTCICDIILDKEVNRELLKIECSAIYFGIFC